METDGTAHKCTSDMELGEATSVKMIFRKRNADTLEVEAKLFLEGLNKEGFRKLRSTKLRAWPVFFSTKEACGEELQKGLVSMWTIYLVVETLLAAVAIQPLVSTQNGLDGSEQEAFGLLWMLALASDFLGLAVTAVFLGFLLAVPSKLTWFWLCEIGCIRRLPTVALMFDTFMSLVAIAYSTWILYGSRIGALCLVIEASCIIIGISIYRYLAFKIEVICSREESYIAPSTSAQ